MISINNNPYSSQSFTGRLGKVNGLEVFPTAMSTQVTNTFKEIENIGPKKLFFDYKGRKNELKREMPSGEFIKELSITGSLKRSFFEWLLRKPKIVVSGVIDEKDITADTIIAALNEIADNRAIKQITERKNIQEVTSQYRK
jgi:hypothetical protein